MIYDVTLTLSPALAGWPGDPPIACTGSTVDGARVSRWTLGSHAGTHVDAPAHFIAGGRTVEEIPPSCLLGPCRMLDLGDAPLVTAAVLAGDDLSGVERLLLRTRNSRHWQRKPTAFDRDFVGIDPGAARALLAAGIRLLGVDGLSVEPWSGQGDVHALLLGAGMVIVEGLALAGVPAGDYQLVCAPLKLKDGDGAPARVFLMS